MSINPNVAFYKMLIAEMEAEIEVRYDNGFNGTDVYIKRMKKRIKELKFMLNDIQ